MELTMVPGLFSALVPSLLSTMVPILLSTMVPSLLSTMVPYLSTTIVTDLFRQLKRATNRTKEKILILGSTFFVYTTLAQQQPKRNLTRSLQRKGTETSKWQIWCPVDLLVKPVLGLSNFKTTIKKEIRLKDSFMVRLIKTSNGLLLLGKIRVMISIKTKQQQIFSIFKDFLRQQHLKS